MSFLFYLLFIFLYSHLTNIFLKFKGTPGSRRKKKKHFPLEKEKRHGE